MKQFMDGRDLVPDQMCRGPGWDQRLETDTREDSLDLVWHVASARMGRLGLKLP